MDHLGRFVGVKDANIRYLALDAMTRMTRSDPKGPLRAQVPPYRSPYPSPDVSPYLTPCLL